MDYGSLKPASQSVVQHEIMSMSQHEISMSHTAVFQSDSQSDSSFVWLPVSQSSSHTAVFQSDSQSDSLVVCLAACQSIIESHYSI
jgi:hypothetical protein